jgi:ATP-dependent exoDNAse (exonuclease V) beta subunit
MFLEKQNKHLRDCRITFDEGPHIYTISMYDRKNNKLYGDSSFTSVTTFVHSHFEKFDADLIINKMMKSDKWILSKYYGMTKQEIKDSWELNRIEASSAGTKLHRDIELYYNHIQINNDSIEYNFFLDFEKERIQLGLIPYRTEMMIFDEEYKLAGSVDMLYKCSDGTYQIYDWKRCKQIKKQNYWRKSKTMEINHIPDCNFWHYTLQLNTYKKILERKYQMIISGMYLVCLHPNFKTYQRIEVEDISYEINMLFEKRLKNILK